MAVRKTKQEYIFCFSVTFICALFFLSPLVWLLSTSVKGPLEAFADPPMLLVTPKFNNFYEIIFNNKRFMKSLMNSLLVALGTVGLTMDVATPAAYGLSVIRGKLKVSVLAWLLMARIAPGMIYVIPFFVIYGQLRMLDTRFGLMLINFIFTFPLAVWMMLAFFEEIPKSVMESAKVDGAGPFNIFTRITIPMITPGIVSSAILCFIFSWNEFMFALILTRRAAKTAPVQIVNFMAYEGVDWGQFASAGILILLPVLMFSFAIRKYLVKGLTAGAVKG